VAIDTPEQQLENVQKAIRAIEAGAQEYTVGNRTVQKARLDTLYKREKELLRQIGVQTYGTRAYYKGVK
jgi:hypothetical protein